MSSYFLYILKCADKTLYTGVTTDVARRVKEHNSSVLGAKYTRARRPVRLVYTKKYRSRSKASQEEFSVKAFSRKEKLALIRRQYTASTRD